MLVTQFYYISVCRALAVSVGSCWVSTFAVCLLTQAEIVLSFIRTPWLLLGSSLLWNVLVWHWVGFWFCFFGLFGWLVGWFCFSCCCCFLPVKLTHLWCSITLWILLHRVELEATKSYLWQKVVTYTLSDSIYVCCMQAV